MIDLTELWNFDDPAGSEQRLRAAQVEAPETEAAVLQTQVARALGLQGRYAEALAVLDGIECTDPEVTVRSLLERGRVYRSSGDVTAAAPLFEAAVAAADQGLEGLAIDAMHMVALTLKGDDQIAYTRGILDRARASRDPSARRWLASLLNNLGTAYSDQGEWQLALQTFEEALAEHAPARTSRPPSPPAGWSPGRCVTWAARPKPATRSSPYRPIWSRPDVRTPTCTRNSRCWTRRERAVRHCGVPLRRGRLRRLLRTVSAARGLAGNGRTVDAVALHRLRPGRRRVPAAHVAPAHQAQRLELDDRDWVGLEITDRVDGAEHDMMGIVGFTAHWVAGRQPGSQTERSAFVRRGGRWVYLAATPDAE